MRVLIALAVCLVLSSPAVAATPTPDASTLLASLDCDDVTAYSEDVYRAAMPEVTSSEYAIVSAALEGESAWRDMPPSELNRAATFYREWARTLRTVSVKRLPVPLREYHELLTRNIELLPDHIYAYLRGDSKAMDAMLAETLPVWERLYEINAAGVEKCGDVWIAALGEPWDPSPDATPEASPRP